MSTLIDRQLDVDRLIIAAFRQLDIVARIGTDCCGILVFAITFHINCYSTLLEYQYDHNATQY